MNKTTAWIVGIVAVLVLIFGGYAIAHHKSTKTNSTSSSSTQNAPAANNAVIITKTDSSLGQYLADPSGKPLYVYNADTKNVSNCTGSCLSNWPAYQASTTTNLPTGISTIKRTDNGQSQYTYNGMPLYYFTGDSDSKVTGNGVENFSVAKPSSASTSTSPPSSNGNSSNSSSSSSNSTNSYPY